MTPEELTQAQEARAVAAEARAVLAEARAVELHAASLAELADVKRHRAAVEASRAADSSAGQHYLRLEMLARIASEAVRDRTTATGKADVPKAAAEAIDIVSQVEAIIWQRQQQHPAIPALDHQGGTSA